VILDKIKKEDDLEKIEVMEKLQESLYLAEDYDAALLIINKIEVIISKIPTYDN
jgi:hypothetical protein